MNYEKQANDFLKGCKATMKIEDIGYTKNPLWDEDKKRITFKITITRNKKQWSFKFYGNLLGDNITPYDVLACIQKYEVSSNLFEFMSEYGYTLEDNNYKQMAKLHKAVMKEYGNTLRLFGDVIEQLQKIQ